MSMGWFCPGNILHKRTCCGSTSATQELDSLTPELQKKVTGIINNEFLDDCGGWHAISPRPIDEGVE